MKFEIIYKLSNKHNINYLCNIVNVSISGYYKHKKLIITNTIKEIREKSDLEIIQTEFLKHNSKHGYRMITMDLKGKGIIMNSKKVIRLMKKYELITLTRKAKPYAKIAKSTKEHKVCKNIINRKFGGLIAFKKIGTDITYLYYNGLRCYLSILKDMVTGEILSFKISSNLGLGFVLATIKRVTIPLKGAIIHSDQGFHYTSPIYQNLLKKKGVIQSMSRKGNCLDNAPTESFFGHFKDEIDLTNCKNLKDVEKQVKEYIIYYNNYRFQRNKKKMTPVQYRNHLQNL